MNLINTHHWDVLAVSCIDGRFIKREIEWLSENAGPVFDYRTEVGDSKAILESREDRERFFDVIRTSVKLHSIKEVWIFDHIDCGAYGGSKHFDGDTDKEKTFHEGKLQEAADIINEEFPELKVRKLYVDWHKVWEIE